jgi:hypothetical protein
MTAERGAAVMTVAAFVVVAILGACSSNDRTTSGGTTPTTSAFRVAPDLVDRLHDQARDHTGPWTDCPLVSGAVVRSSYRTAVGASLGGLDTADPGGHGVAAGEGERGVSVTCTWLGGKKHEGLQVALIDIPIVAETFKEFIGDTPQHRKGRFTWGDGVFLAYDGSDVAILVIPNVRHEFPKAEAMYEIGTRVTDAIHRHLEAPGATTTTA